LKKVFTRVVWTPYGFCDFIAKKGGTWYLIEAKIVENGEEKAWFNTYDVRLTLDLVNRTNGILAVIVKTKDGIRVIEGKKLYGYLSEREYAKGTMRLEKWLEYSYDFKEWLDIVRGKKKRYRIKSKMEKRKKEMTEK